MNSNDYDGLSETSPGYTGKVFFFCNVTPAKSCGNYYQNELVIRGYNCSAGRLLD